MAKKPNRFYRSFICKCKMLDFFGGGDAFTSTFSGDEMFLYGYVLLFIWTVAL